MSTSDSTDVKTVTHIYAISDIHVDYSGNRQLMETMQDSSFASSALILAGDVTHNIALLEQTLRTLKEKFAVVFFVPGNHDLWIEKGDGFKDSLKKFYAILQMCKQVGVYTDVVKLHVMQEETGDIQPLWVVPLYSWYVKPEDDAMESLYYQPKSGKLEDVEHMEAIWADNIRCKWPTMTETLASYFASLNEANLSRTYDCPVISFTHFVPRQDLVIPTQEDLDQANKERQRQGTPIIEKLAEPALDKFNISRYSGAKVIDRQLRQIGSVLHVYGHQHSNRDRSMEGVRYVSHCLGYPKEGKSGMTWGISEWKGPKVIWPQNKVSKSDA